MDDDGDKSKKPITKTIKLSLKTKFYSVVLCRCLVEGVVMVLVVAGCGEVEAAAAAATAAAAVVVEVSSFCFLIGTLVLESPFVLLLAARVW